MSFTVCVFMFATLFAKNPSSTDCKENMVQEAVDTVRAECAAVAKDPLRTCEMVRMSDTKYAVFIRKLDGV